MDSTSPDEVSIFNVARLIAIPEERRLYLDSACAGNLDLRARLEVLLRAHDEEPAFLELPLTEVRAVRDSSVSEGPAQIGPYKILEQIGEGGFGVVFMAEQRQPVRRMVALKIVKPGMDTRQVVARFESERQSLALMSHPNIAQIIDGGETASGRPYFVMELVRGVPITEFCDKNRSPAEERLKLFVSVCHAIQHAHHKGVIHRDIKPTNVMVTLDDGIPVVKVIDFGVAKAITQRLTEKTLFTAYGQMIGTPAYMSPEQASMSLLDVDTRSDIYSLGVLLYELLTGTTPIETAGLREAGYAEIQRLITEQQTPRPSTRLSALGDTAIVVAGNRATDPKHLSRLLAGDLDWIVMKALEKDRNRRYASPGIFADDVERYLRREAILARPPSATYRLVRFAQRRKGAVLAGAAVALTLLVGTSVSTWQAIVATRAREAALIAAMAEKKAKETAEAKEAETRTVLDFVQSRIFAAARPEGEAGGLGHDVTLKRAALAALAYVDRTFGGQPLIEARLRATLGTSFLYLGEAKVAADQYDRAHSIYEKMLGPNDPITLQSTNNLAGSFRALGLYPRALELYQDTLVRREKALGRMHPETLHSMNNLATIYEDLGRYPESLALREKTLEMRKAIHGPAHLDTLRSMINLANSYAEVGQGEKALKLDEEALELAIAALGADNSETLALKNNLALSYASMHRYQEAFKLREETVALYKSKYGAKHPLTLMTMLNLGKAYSDLNQHAEAVRVLEETLALQKIKPGPDHPDTLQTMYTLAKALDSLHRHPDALKYHAEALELRKTKLGPDHRNTLYSMWGVAANLLKLDRGAEAVPIIDEVLERAARQTGNLQFSGLANLRLDYFEKLKDAAGCRRTAELWENFKLKDAGSLYVAAQYCAAAAAVLRATDKSLAGAKEADAEADRAMAWLRQAVAAGYHDVATLKENKNLGSLHKRADFQALVAELEAKKK